MYYDISSARLSLLTPSHLLAGTMMPRSKTQCILGDYSPNDVEGEFSEGRRKQNVLTRLPLSLLCSLGEGTTRSRGFEARTNYGRLRDGQSQ
jgi:hypothetical protein